jgi:ABC-2 type transport system ATP-binding protein
VNLQVRKDGKGNWEDFGEAGAAEPETPEPQAAARTATIDLASVAVTNAALTYTDASTGDRYELTERVGAQLQESRLQDKIEVGEVLDLYASFYRNPADWRGLVDRLGLGGKVDARYGDLSGGQKQRLSVALALVGSPEIAVFDELTTGLDPQARRATWDTIEQIRDDGVTVVLVTHFMEEAERLCDRIMVVDHGRVVAIDTASALMDRLGSEQRLRFRPSAPVADADLLGLPEVVAVDHRGPQVVVTGGGNVVQAVTALLTKHEVVAEDLRIEQRSLEEAYLALTDTPEAANEGEER